jgi:hypothetical protein
MTDVRQEFFKEQVQSGEILSHPGPTVFSHSEPHYDGVPISLMASSKYIGGTPRDLDGISQNFRDSNFERFAKEAYDSPEGYAIRINPLTGEKELFVAGTRDMGQWGLNVLDGVLQISEDQVEDTFLGKNVANNMQKVGLDLTFDFNKFDTPREQTKSKMEDIVRRYHIDVVYGHSRGGSLVADMKVPKGVKKIGLDAAMLTSHNKQLVNLNEGTGALFKGPKAFLKGVPDSVLDARGQNNYYYDASPGSWSTSHFSYKWGS